MNLRIQTGVILLSRVIVNDFSSDEQISVLPLDELLYDESDEVFTVTKLNIYTSLLWLIFMNDLMNIQSDSYLADILLF